MISNYNSFTYDPFGRRITKKVDTVTAGVTATTTFHYLYDNDDIAVEFMTDGNGTVQTVYTHGPGTDEPLALERNNQYAYYHADGLGSIVALTDNTGNVLQTYAYDSFGGITPTTAFRNTFTYTGREYDEETGLYFYRARYYDPKLGRFLNPDPIGFAGGDTNLYAYVGNNPVNYTDPEGLNPAAAGFIYEAIKWGGAALIAAMAIDTAQKAPKTIRITSNTQTCPLLPETPEEKRRRCNREWEDAQKQCKDWLSQPNPPRGLTGGYTNPYDCARGHVSEECGGNPVSWRRR